jgi:hypothetical protein
MTQFGKFTVKLPQFIEATNFLSANRISYSTLRIDVATFTITITNPADRKPTLSTHELQAVHAWALRHGRTWKDKLREAWYSGNYNGFEDYGTLQSIRNNPAFGPEWLNAFKLEK